MARGLVSDLGSRGIVLSAAKTKVLINCYIVIVLSTLSNTHLPADLDKDIALQLL